MITKNFKGRRVLLLLLFGKGARVVENNDVAGGHFWQTVLTTYLSDDCPVYGAFKFGLYVLPRFVFRNLLSGLAYSVHTDYA